MNPIAYAIDFGTTNSVIAAVFSDSEHIELIPARQENGAKNSATPFLMPSSLYLDRTGQVQPGWTGLELFVNMASSSTKCKHCKFADLKDNPHWNEDSVCSNTKASGDCFDSRLMSGVKEEMANQKVIRTHSWGRNFDSIQVVTAILLGLKRNAEAHLNLAPGTVTRAVIGHPVVFPGAEGEDSQALQQKAIEVLQAAAHAAGIDKLTFASEATAAGLVAQIPRGKILALDFGAGTFDVSTAECEGGITSILSNHGSAVGGNRIDLALFDCLVAPRMGLGSKTLGISASKGVSNSVVAQLSSLNRFIRALHNRDIRASIAVNKSLPGNQALYEADALLSSGNGIDVYRAIQFSKAELSNTSEVSMAYQLPGMARTIIRFPLEVLNEVVDSLMPHIWEPIDQALLDSDWKDEEIDFLLLTGGSSQLTRFRSLILSRFGNAQIIENDAFTTVVKGLAVRAKQIWGPK